MYYGRTYADKRTVNEMKVYLERNNSQVELIRCCEQVLTLFTFTSAKRQIQCKMAHRTQIMRFRTQTTSAPFLTQSRLTRGRESMHGYTIHCSTIQYNTIQYNTIQYTVVQYNTIQYNTIQYNTIQYNTINKEYRTQQRVNITGLACVKHDYVCVFWTQIRRYYNISLCVSVC